MFEPWGRFVVTRNDYHGPAVILGDYQFWSQHQEELTQWCEENGARQQGMTVEMSDEALTLFVLRWS